MAADEVPIEPVLSFPIMLSERLHQEVAVANSFKFECSEVGKQSDRLTQMLRSALRFATSNNSSLYETPIRRIVSEVSNNLKRALTLVHKCRSRNFLRRVVTIVSAADFRRVFNILDASIGDLKWLLSLFDFDGAAVNGAGGIIISLPPIATNDPILSWVWSFIANIYLGQLTDKIEAVNELSSVARDSDRNKKIIVEEGGIPPLIKLLKERASPEAQIAVVNALAILANDQHRVRMIANELGVLTLITVLGNSQMMLQISVANLVARMAEYDFVVKEEFARENATRPLVTLVSSDTFPEDMHKASLGKQSIHKQLDRNSLTPEMKLKLKTICSEALWMLARGSVSNSRRITESNGLTCLAKLIETEQEEFQINCLMTIMEITAAAESDAELRREAFKTNSPAAKAVVEQLVRLIKHSNNSTLQIPAIRAIGSLARTFPARQTWVVVPIVEQLGSQNQEVSTEAAIALGKFVSPENFLCAEHTKTIIEHAGVNSLMRRLRGNEIAKLHGVVLLCYLALHVGEKEISEHGRMLTALEGAVRTFTVQYPEFREVISRAIARLNVYHEREVSGRLSYAP